MPLRGRFTPPGDKSVSHRLVLLALLAKGEMLVRGLSDCDDVASSLRCFRALGGKAVEEQDGIRITGLDRAFPPMPESGEIDLDCANSGTTMRLLAGILAGAPGRYVLTGDAQLTRRPMERVAEPLRLMGARVTTVAGKPPVTVEGGNVVSTEYHLKDASAQVKGAVLMAGLSASDGGATKVVEKAATRAHTERLIDFFKGRVQVDGLKISVWPGTLELSESFLSPSDPSSAAFFLAGAAIIPGSRVTAENILLSPGRTGFLRVLDRMGANVSITLSSDTPEPVGEATVEYSGVLKGVEIAPEEVPSMIDEVPVLALAATQAEGRTVFRKVDELRIKETDRLMSIRHQLGALGARIRVEGDDLVVEGPTSFIIPETLDSGSDHRLAMTLSMALQAARASIPIIGSESISISYPGFHAQLEALCRG
ncbi:MAG: 3-phosphoshikimate 1-carboxyvinyltransferase [Deltaproteobacteria bacterium]|jgi:3-phosphoshikimate 1-carboxyvinyltransferase|nr:3-phosphoshikimate 1-carboxyvinyltransferase [Deltaproteobacteria bacterium]